MSPVNNCFWIVPYVIQSNLSGSYILYNTTHWGQDRSLYLTLRGTMPQIKTRRLVRKGDIRDMHSYRFYTNDYHHLDKPKTCNTNVEELNKNIKQNYLTYSIHVNSIKTKKIFHSPRTCPYWFFFHPFLYCKIPLQMVIPAPFISMRFKLLAEKNYMCLNKQSCKT